MGGDTDPPLRVPLSHAHGFSDRGPGVQRHPLIVGAIYHLSGCGISVLQIGMGPLGVGPVCHSPGDNPEWISHPGACVSVRSSGSNIYRFADSQAGGTAVLRAFADTVRHSALHPAQKIKKPRNSRMLFV